MAVSVETQVCKDCQQELSLDGFGLAPAYKGKQYHRKVCKTCQAIRRGRTPGKPNGSVRDGKKECTACHEVKPVGDFYIMSSGYPAGNCKKCTNEKARLRYQQDPEFRAKKIAYARQYFLDNYAQQCASTAINAQSNRTRYTEYSARYRARVREATIEEVDYEEIVRRDKMICHICQETVLIDDLSFDHVVPLSREGDHSMSNIKVAHLLCNVRKNDRLMSEISV